MQVKKEITFSAAQAHLYGLAFAIPLPVLFGCVFYLIWHSRLTLLTFAKAIPSGLWMALIILVGVIFHELIHGISWAFFTKDGFKSVKYGIEWKSFTPYCHCKTPLQLNHYLVGGLMPGILLGVLPSLIGIIMGNVSLLLLGIFFTLTAGGDFLIAWHLRKENKHSLVQDHAEKIGCYVFSE
jgi:hypothetical protein